MLDFLSVKLKCVPILLQHFSFIFIHLQQRVSREVNVLQQPKGFQLYIGEDSNQLHIHFNTISSANLSLTFVHINGRSYIQLDFILLLYNLWHFSELIASEVNALQHGTFGEVLQFPEVVSM